MVLARLNFVLIGIFAALLMLPTISIAQEAAAVTQGDEVQQTEEGQEEAAEAEVVEEEPEEDRVILSVKGDGTEPTEIPSLFFTPEALALLKDAIKGLNTGIAGGDVGPGSEKEPGIRELALGGIVFKEEGDWTIWLNGRRITPDTIPGEIFDLKVQKEYVDIKWYDAFTNRLFPVRLRANERFNLDSRLFLTGSHSEDQQL